MVRIVPMVLSIALLCRVTIFSPGALLGDSFQKAGGMIAATEEKLTKTHNYNTTDTQGREREKEEQRRKEGLY